jgi:hypothetical protein
VRVRILFAMLMGCWLGGSALGQSKILPPVDPGRPAAPAETIAQTIARNLRESGQLSRYRVNVMHQGNGVIDLVGEIADEGQRATVIDITRKVPGVRMVRDWMQVRDLGIVPVQGPLIQPIPLPLPQPVDKDKGGIRVPERIDGQLQDPTPIFQGPGGAGAPGVGVSPPPLPPYAWPTFAPYNNYSRVAYPNAYPYEQWPFIGPMYPFPRVPLGWRSVCLTWEDGHWWFHRNPTGHDWWRIRYH